MLLRFLIENGDVSVLENLKKITVKDEIYWAAESWENTSVNLLRKSWKKLWPSLQFNTTSPVTEDDRTEVLNLVQLQKCCKRFS